MGGKLVEKPDINLDILKAGKLGEDLTINELKKLDYTFVKIHGFRLFLGRKSLSAEIDHLLISKGGVFLIDSKHWSGEIEFTYPGMKRVKRSGEIEIISPKDDPTGQLEHHKYVFEQLMNQLGFYNVKIFGVLCFTTNNVTIKNDNPKFKALKLSQLNDYILENSQEEVLTFEQILQIKDYIEKNGAQSTTYDNVSQSTNQSTYTNRNNQTYRPKNTHNKSKRKNSGLAFIAIIAIIIIGTYMLGIFDNNDGETAASKIVPSVVEKIENTDSNSEPGTEKDAVEEEKASEVAVSNEEVTSNTDEEVQAVTTTAPSNETGISDLSHIPPYTTGDMAFSDFALTKHSDGYYLEMTITNTNKSKQIALGWVGDGAVTIKTDKGSFSDGFPHMAKLQPGTAGNYSFAFKGASGIPTEVVLENIYVLDDRGLPGFDPNNDYTIPLN